LGCAALPSAGGPRFVSPATREPIEYDVDRQVCNISDVVSVGVEPPKQLSKAADRSDPNRREKEVRRTDRTGPHAPLHLEFLDDDCTEALDGCQVVLEDVLEPGAWRRSLVHKDSHDSRVGGDLQSERLGHILREREFVTVLGELRKRCLGNCRDDTAEAVVDGGVPQPLLGAVSLVDGVVADADLARHRPQRGAFVAEVGERAQRRIQERTVVDNLGARHRSSIALDYRGLALIDN